MIFTYRMLFQSSADSADEWHFEQSFHGSITRRLYPKVGYICTICTFFNWGMQRQTSLVMEVTLIRQYAMAEAGALKEALIALIAHSAVVLCERMNGGAAKSGNKFAAPDGRVAGRAGAVEGWPPAGCRSEKPLR
jgi:hypothetical protein